MCLNCCNIVYEYINAVGFEPLKLSINVTITVIPIFVLYCIYRYYILLKFYVPFGLHLFVTN